MGIDQTVSCDCPMHKGRNSPMKMDTPGWAALFFSHLDATKGYHFHSEYWCPECVKRCSTYNPVEQKEREGEEDHSSSP